MFTHEDEELYVKLKSKISTSSMVPKKFNLSPKEVANVSVCYCKLAAGTFATLIFKFVAGIA